MNAMNRRAGFTLIEVLACVALLVILCTIAGLSLRGRQGRGEMELAVEQIRFADVQARERARRSGQEVHLRFDLEQGGGVWVESVNGAESVRLPEGCRVARVYSSGRAVREREATIACSAGGCSRSYGVLIVGASKEERWILVTGLTGAMRTVSDERSVEDILYSTASAGDDAR